VVKEISGRDELYRQSSRHRREMGGQSEYIKQEQPRTVELFRAGISTSLGEGALGVEWKGTCAR